MKIDKRVEIFIIATILLFIVLIFCLLGLISWLCYMVIFYWWRYLGIKTVCFLTTNIIILYLAVRFYERLVRKYRAERLRRFRIWCTFYMELRNEAYLRGARRRREQAKRAREIRQQNDKEFEQRMKRLVEGGKTLGEKREQCVKEYKQSLKTREDARKILKEENENTTSPKNEAPKLLLPLLKERREKMEKIIQRRNDERKKNSQENKDNNSSINHKVQTPNLASIRAAVASFMKGVKRIDQVCKSCKITKMYYMLYNIDFAITNVLFSLKELLNSGYSMPLTQQSNHDTLGWSKSVTNKESQSEQQAKPSSAADIHCVEIEEEINQLLSTAYSKILLVKDRVLQSVNHLDEEQSSTLATPGMVETTKKTERMGQLDIQQIQNCFRQEDIIEVFKDLRDVILPKFRKCITKRMEKDKINTTNMDNWEKRYNENMTKVHNRQSLTHLEVGNGYVGKIFVGKSLKEKGSLEKTQSLWSYVHSDQPEKRKKKTRWLESFRRSNKDNGATYLAVGSAAVVITAAFAVYRYIR